MTGDGAPLAVGDRVRVLLEGRLWRAQGWGNGTIMRIDPYTVHRSFYWVELEGEAQAAYGGRTRLVSVLNPRNIIRI